MTNGTTGLAGNVAVYFWHGSSGVYISEKSAAGTFPMSHWLSTAAALPVASVFGRPVYSSVYRLDVCVSGEGVPARGVTGRKDLRV